MGIVGIVGGEADLIFLMLGDFGRGRRDRQKVDQIFPTQDAGVVQEAQKQVDGFNSEMSSYARAGGIQPIW